MSKTIKGSKGPGFEYQGKHPFNRHGGTYSPNGNTFAKRRANKATRVRGKNLVDKDLRND